MEKYLPGTIQQINEIPAGSCVLFAVHQKARVGFIVEIGDGQRGILDIEAKPKDGNERPAIYLLESFSGERALVYAGARIVPGIAPELIGFGYHGSGGSSKALYLCGTEIIVLAEFQQRRMKVNMESGLISQLDVAHGLHCLRWQIQVPDVDGEFRKIAEFSA
ncbi:hypothetical protein MKK67_06745 [Methylobacterium sp. J-072]|uniref:hypothetical protein n=1 Tax=Methylobacterium sp. J-072 TaxID=2836651 RepID=UPI001FB8F693|nr:hypothetical protein [Methylobacterium sp. J-072]MCJ2092194.1 hypothetical protein [Methylobacterium sp. J-072]